MKALMCPNCGSGGFLIGFEPDSKEKEVVLLAICISCNQKVAIRPKTFTNPEK